MNCPKCDSKINENQKFCTNCGHNITKSNPILQVLSFIEKADLKILSIIFIPLIILGLILGFVCFNQTKKMQSPITVYGHYGDITTKLEATYNPKGNYVSFVFSFPYEVKQWQIDAQKTSTLNYSLTFRSPKHGSETFDFNANISSGDTEIFMYKTINNIKLSEYARLKELMQSDDSTLTSPYYFSTDKKELAKHKKEYDDYLLKQRRKAEEERKRKEREAATDALMGLGALMFMGAMF